MNFSLSLKRFVGIGVILLFGFGAAHLAAGESEVALDSLAPGVLKADEVLGLLKRKKYDELEGLAAELRTGERRTPSGRWELHIFYETLEDNATLSQLESWKKAHPKSVTVAVAIGRRYIKDAWKNRGGGYADTVTNKGQAGFEQNLTKALETLAAAEKLEETDPDLYSSLIRVAMGMSQKRAVVDELFKKGIAVNRTYYSLYSTYLIYLLPRWHGDPGDVEDLARRAALMTKQAEGDGFYARMAMFCYDYVSLPEIPAAHEFDWEKLRKGFKDLEEKYPDSKTNLNYFGLFASVYADKDTAADVFKRLGNDYDPYVWEGKGYFNRCVDWALKDGPYPGMGLIAEAIEHANLEVVQQLIDEGMDINEVNIFGNPPLHHTIWQEKPEIAEALIERGININATDDEGWTALMLAASKGNLKFVELLLKHKADMNVVTAEGWTALSIAINEKHELIAKLLIRAGADANISSPEGFGALFQAVDVGDAELVKRLLKDGADPNVKGKLGWTALLVAATKNEVESARLLLEAKADPNLINDEGYTPLAQAVVFKHWEIAKLLLESGADANIPEPKLDWTPLHMACKEGNADGVKLLLDHDADPDLPCKDGWNPLLTAIRMKKSKAALALLEHPEIDVNVKNAKKVSALQWAVRMCDVEVTARLLELGANPDTRASDGSTPLGDTKVAKCPELEPVIKKALQEK